MFGTAGEIFEEALVPFLPRILGTLQKQIREDATMRLHQAIAETIGQLVFNIIDKLESREEQKDLFQNQFLRFAFSLLEKSSNKLVQSGAISCLSKIIINCPGDILSDSLGQITDKMIQVFRIKNF